MCFDVNSPEVSPEFSVKEFEIRFKKRRISKGI